MTRSKSETKFQEQLDAELRAKQPEEPKPEAVIKFGTYTQEFMEREADLVLGGDVARLDRHTQKFINSVLVAALIKMRKKNADLELGRDKNEIDINAMKKDLVIWRDRITDTAEAFNKRVENLEEEITK